MKIAFLEEETKIEIDEKKFAVLQNDLARLKKMPKAFHRDQQIKALERMIQNYSKDTQTI